MISYLDLKEHRNQWIIDINFDVTLDIFRSSLMNLLSFKTFITSFVVDYETFNEMSRDLLMLHSIYFDHQFVFTFKTFITPSSWMTKRSKKSHVTCWCYTRYISIINLFSHSKHSSLLHRGWRNVQRKVTWLVDVTLDIFRSSFCFHIQNIHHSFIVDDETFKEMSRDLLMLHSIYFNHQFVFTFKTFITPSSYMATRDVTVWKRI